MRATPNHFEIFKNLVKFESDLASDPPQTSFDPRFRVPPMVFELHRKYFFVKKVTDRRKLVFRAGKDVGRVWGHPEAARTCGQLRTIMKISEN